MPSPSADQTGAMSEESGSRSAVAHTMPEYLPRTSTFVHTLLRFQREYRPIVFARRLTHLDEFPLEAEICTLGSPDSAFTRLNERLPVLPASVRDTFARKLPGAVRQRRCVLVHAHFGWAGLASLGAARRLGIPLVTSFYGRDLAERKRRWQRRPVYDRLFREGTLFLCEGPAMLEYLVGLGCPREKIRIARIGIDLSQFPFSPPARDRPLVVVQAARLVEKKGVDLSIRGFAAARPAIGPSQLWIVGDGPMRAELESLVESLGLTDSVRFLGELPYAEYRELLRRAHIGIQPSRTAPDGDTEGGAPTVLLEMQALGLPVVVTRHADIPFVVSEDGWLADEEDVAGLADALVALAAMPEQDWRAHSTRARRAIEARHDAAVVARAIESLYGEARTGFEPRRDA